MCSNIDTWDHFALVAGLVCCLASAFQKIVCYTIVFKFLSVLGIFDRNTRFLAIWTSDLLVVITIYLCKLTKSTILPPCTFITYSLFSLCVTHVFILIFSFKLWKATMEKKVKNVVSKSRRKSSKEPDADAFQVLWFSKT